MKIPGFDLPAGLSGINFLGWGVFGSVVFLVVFFFFFFFFLDLNVQP